MLAGTAHETFSCDTAASQWKDLRADGGWYSVSFWDRKSISMFMVTDGRFAPDAGAKSTPGLFVSDTGTPVLCARPCECPMPVYHQSRGGEGIRARRCGGAPRAGCPFRVAGTPGGRFLSIAPMLCLAALSVCISFAVRTVW